ncbi:uncharacterized protein LOC108095121 [Drosophila ficusphila]|uniref:uncharacterized protein LOC108095121 n=1 Tax=Drosophila ficusphila TaxID=30025 RepID=UPI0007E5C473|nr:uncharacterized protein LOC108095121 [Drosophila ficusphila]
MLDILGFWLILYLFELSQGRSVGGGWGNFDEQEEFPAPQPDPTIFLYNQTDKELLYDNSWR